MAFGAKSLVVFLPQTTQQISANYPTVSTTETEEKERLWKTDSRQSARDRGKRKETY